MELQEEKSGSKINGGLTITSSHLAFSILLLLHGIIDPESLLLDSDLLPFHFFSYRS
jgi:hypothetical protein